MFKLLLLIIILIITLSTLVNASIPIIDDSEECTTCLSTLTEWQTIFTNETDISIVSETLQQHCKDKYSVKDIVKRKLCEAVYNVLIQIPPGLIDGMDSLAWPIPKAFCGTIKKCNLYCCDDSNIPEQVHLSCETDISRMTVSWTTLNSQNSIVQYGTSIDSLNKQVDGTVNTYTASGWRGSLHSATMTGLIENGIYYYRVGDKTNDIWSQVFSFKTFNRDQPISYAIISDMAYDSNSDYTVKSMIELVDAGKIDAVIHSGDISYADGYDPHFDDFFNKIEPIASRVPYLVSPGNHEFWYDFVAYKNRFAMPGHAITKSMYYTWKNGPATFISLNSETAIDTADFHDLEIQFLKKTLDDVDRVATPFIIVHFHRPLYCSNDDECVTKAAKLKSKAEDILYAHSVDLVMSGHVHSYERTYNVYNNTIDPQGPVYLTQGASGNREGNKGGFPSDLPNWSANHSTAIGFGVLTISATQMDFSFYNSETNTDLLLLDKVSILKKN